MKRTLSIIVVCFVVALIIVVCITPKTLDFRGTVTDIEHTDDQTIFYIFLDETTSYTVVANSKTKVAQYDDKADISLTDIAVGDAIQGNYRWMSKENIAKSITVLY